MNKQEVYNTVRDHLLKQMEHCRVSDGACAYRGEGTMRCGIGGLMNEEEIKHLGDFGGGVRNLMDPGNLTTRVTKSDTEFEWSTKFKLRLEVNHEDDMQLLVDLQNVHDENGPEDWKNLLEQTAITHNLQP